MKIFRSRQAAAIAIAAALSLTASPAMARGWGHRHHDRGIDGGDIFAGLLVIGGIAAIASAANKKNKDSREADYRYPDRDYRAGEEPYREPVPDYVEPRGDRPEAGSGYRSGNLDGAVDICVDEVERGSRRVDSVDAVNREGDGWRVQGRSDGRDFSCTVDRDGRIRGMTVDGAALYN